jgi:hypothetical protein
VGVAVASKSVLKVGTSKEQGARVGDQTSISTAFGNTVTRNFKFPPSDAHAPSFFMFIRFPNDIRLLQSCRNYRTGQKKNRSWKSAVRSIWSNSASHLEVYAHLSVPISTCGQVHGSISLGEFVLAFQRHLFADVCQEPAVRRPGHRLFLVQC